MNRSLAPSRRRSAGTMSPADKCTMSPATSSITGTSMRSLWPSEARRVTVAVLRTIALSFSAAREDRNSWVKLSTTLMPTITAMMIGPVRSPCEVTSCTPASTSSTTMNGFQNVSASCNAQCGGFSWVASLAPSRSRRSSICASSRPSVLVSSDASNAAASVHALPATIGRTCAARGLPGANLGWVWEGEPDITRFRAGGRMSTQRVTKPWTQGARPGRAIRYCGVMPARTQEIRTRNRPSVPGGRRLRKYRRTVAITRRSLWCVRPPGAARARSHATRDGARRGG